MPDFGVYLKDPATGLPYRASGGGGSGGGGDASAANQTATQAAPGSNATKADAVQGVDGGRPVGVTATNTAFGSTALVVTGDQAYAVGEQRQITMAPSGGVKVGVSYNANIAPAAPTAGGLNSALVGAKYYATRPAWTDGFTGAVQVDVGGNLWTRDAIIGATVGTPGNAAPATAQQIAGVGPGGNTRALFTGTNGGLLPGQAAPVSTRTVVAANTAATIDVARATRLGLNLKNETATTAVIYISYTGTASATNYDDIFPISSAVGVNLTPLFAATGAVSAFSTAGFTITSTSWLPA